MPESRPCLHLKRGGVSGRNRLADGSMRKDLRLPLLASHSEGSTAVTVCRVFSLSDLTRPFR